MARLQSSTITGSLVVTSTITAPNLSGTASWATNAVNGGTQVTSGSSWNITASWAVNAINGGTQLYTASKYPITASWAETASVAITSSMLSAKTVGANQFVSNETYVQSGKTLPINWGAGQAIMVGNKAYLFGGQTAQNVAPQAVIYTSSASDPSTIGTSGQSLPIGTCFFPLKQINNNLYIFGGIAGASSVITSSILAASTSTPLVWAKVGDLPIPVYGHQIISLDDKLYLFGGIDGRTGIINTASYTASVTNPLSWSVIQPITWAGPAGPVTMSYRGDVTVIGNKIWSIGGFNAEGRQNSLAYNTYTASTLTPLTWGLCNFSGANSEGVGASSKIVVGNKIYFLGGYGGAQGATRNNIWGIPLNDESKLSLGFDTTNRVTTLPLSGGYNSATVIYGGKVYYYGGADGVNYPACFNYIFTSSYVDLGITASAYTGSVSGNDIIQPQAYLINGTASVYDVLVPITASWANNSSTASYISLAQSASWADTLEGLHGSSYQGALITASTITVTASWARSASWADTLEGLHGSSYQGALITASTIPVTSSWAVNAQTASAIYIPSGSGAWRLQMSSSGDLVFIFS